MNNRIYIIRSDISISTLLKDYIDRYGFEAVVATNFNDIKYKKLRYVDLV